MLEFLNEVLAIKDLEPDAYQMGISGKSGAKMSAPDGGKATMKGNRNYDPALHPRYPKGTPKGGKFMPKGSKDQIQAVAKAKGVSTDQAAAMVGAKPNKGKLKKFEGSAGAVGKAQKILRDKNATPEQRAKAKASIAKAADKMRISKMSTGELFKESDRIMSKPIYKEGGKAGGDAEKSKRGKISNKELMARNAGTSAPVPTGSMIQGVSKKVVQQRAIETIRKVEKKASEGSTSAQKALERYGNNAGARSTYGSKVYGSAWGDSASTVSNARKKFKKDSLALAEKAKANYGYSSRDSISPAAKSIARNERKKAKKAAIAQNKRNKEASRLLRGDKDVEAILTGTPPKPDKMVEPKRSKISNKEPQAKRSAQGQRSSLDATFPAGVAANIARFQAVLKDKNSTPEQKQAAKRFIKINVKQSTSRLIDSQGRKNNADVDDKGNVYVGQRLIRFGKASRAQSARENR